MKPLQITLFVIANVIFITQAGRHIHQMFFGIRPSALDEFVPERKSAQAEQSFAALVAEFRTVHAEIFAKQKGNRQLAPVFMMTKAAPKLNGAATSGEWKEF